MRGSSSFNRFLGYLVGPISISCGSIVYADKPVSIHDYIAEKNDAQVAELANQWWQWVYTFPRQAGPTVDNTGAMCAFMQSERTWFLANSDTPEVVDRTCTIPVETRVFFPIISNVQFSPPNVELTCAEVLEGVTFERNPNYVVTASLNGTSIQLGESSIVGSSTCFDLLSRVPASRNPPSYYPSATDGYWVLIEPLPVGAHELEFMAEYRDTEQNIVRTMMHVRYQLIVGEE